MTIAVWATEDAVCGMTVGIEQGRANSLTLTHQGRQYAFCGKGCLLEFRDDPERYSPRGNPG